MPRADSRVPLAAVRARVTVAHLGCLDRAVRGEVAAGDEVEHVPAGLVGPGDPRGARPDVRVQEVAHLRRRSRPRARPDRCSPSPAPGAPAKSASVKASTAAGSTWAASRFSSTSRSPGRPIANGSRVPSGCASTTSDVLERVPGLPRPVRARVSALRWSTSVWIVGVSGVSSTCAAGASSYGSGVGRRDAHGLDVGGVVAVGAADVGVLADLGRGEELLGLRAAHGAAESP